MRQTHRSKNLENPYDLLQSIILLSMTASCPPYPRSYRSRISPEPAFFIPCISLAVSPIFADRFAAIAVHPGSSGIKEMFFQRGTISEAHNGDDPSVLVLGTSFTGKYRFNYNAFFQEQILSHIFCSIAKFLIVFRRINSINTDSFLVLCAFAPCDERISVKNGSNRRHI